MQLLEALEAVSVVPFTKALGWTVEDVHLFLADVRRDLKKKSVHLLHDLLVFQHVPLFQTRPEVRKGSRIK